MRSVYAFMLQSLRHRRIAARTPAIEQADEPAPPGGMVRCIAQPLEMDRSMAGRVLRRMQAERRTGDRQLPVVGESDAWFRDQLLPAVADRKSTRLHSSP